MRKTKKRFLSALLACTMLIGLFPFAAFADSGTTIYVDAASTAGSETGAEASPYKTLEAALEVAQNGDTINLAAGTYTTPDNRYVGAVVNIVGEGADSTIIEDGLWMGANYQTPVTTVSNVSVSGVTFENTNGSSNWSTVGLGFTQIEGANITVNKCTFDGFQYGVHMNGTNAGTTLNVTNTDFDNTFISISAQLDPNGATLGTIEEVTTTEGAYAVQAFGNDADHAAQNYHYTTIKAYEEAAVAGTGVGMSGFDNSVLDESEYVGAGEVKGNVVATDTDLHDAITNTKTTPRTIILADDITLSESIVLAADQNITINGNGHTISYVGNNGTTSNAAFKITGSLGDESSNTPENVSLTVNNVKFTSTAAGSNGYGVLVGANAKGANVKLNSCEFNNLYCGILVNQFMTQSDDNVASISISNSTFNNTKYGYSIDESTTNALVGAVEATFTNNGEVTESEPWPNVEAYVTRGGFTTVASSFADAVTNAQAGDVITLAKDLDSNAKINLPADVTLDGNGHALTYTGTDKEQAFITASTNADNVTVKNITINANNIKHGVQFYCCDGGTLENAVVNGGIYTAVIVNGATNVTIADSILNPADDAYTNIEYGMGGGVTDIPSMSVDNVSFDSSKPYVWADKDTTGRVDAAMSGKQSKDEVLAKILDNISYTNDNGGRLEITVGFADGSEMTGSVESTYQPPYTGKYSYEITIADTDNGTISVDKYATEGEDVTITVTPDKGYKLDELTVTAGSKDVDVKDNGNGTYTFTMPSSKVKVAATFVEDENYDDSITISMTVGSNDFVINDTIVTIPDAAPYIANSRTYVPFRALGEAIGADVVWDNDARTVTYTLDGNEIVMTIGSTTYTVNGVEKTMDVAPEITGERTYVPIRFIGEALGFKVTPLYAEDGTTASVVFEK